MSGLEMVLLIIGLICIVASFIFSERFDKESTGGTVNYELSEKQKEDIKNQIVNVFDDEIDRIKENTEASLDKLSNQKIMELNEYSETVLADINKNHQEAMFLYEMLNEKKKEVKNTVRDINLVQKEIKSNTEKQVLDDTSDAGFMASELIMQEEQKAKTAKAAKAEKPEMSEKPEKAAKKSAEKKPAPKKTTPKKTEKQTVNINSIEIEGSANNNEKILALHDQGKSNIDIARELGLGIGEVKLVIDLFTGRNA